MAVSSPELLSVLRQYNPWWRDGRTQDIPAWRRTVFSEVFTWMLNPPTHRALLLTGARQVGKTTLLLQTIQELLQKGVPPSKILYATFDHPLIKPMGLDGLMQLWREVEPSGGGIEYVFLDEIQYAKDWQVWLKHQVDFQKERRIAATGSATPLLTQSQESGVGRWHTIPLSTLSFFEYLRLKKVEVPTSIPMVNSLSEVFNWPRERFVGVSVDARPLVGHFHEYLLRGGYPQTVLIENITQAQRLLREDILDKVLKRDMTALFGVRRVFELEQVFLYLCMHEGGIVDIAGLSKNLEVKRPTASNFIALLESAHLIHRLQPFGYGKEVLRGQHKIYLADAALAPSVLLKGKALLEDSAGLGIAAETAFFNHIYSRFSLQNISFSYWRGRKDEEVDVIASTEGRLVPFEVKYRDFPTGTEEFKGLRHFCEERAVDHGYVITKDILEFKCMPLPGCTKKVNIAKIPAPLACYWLGGVDNGSSKPTVTGIADV
jgi:predicted AAA+ superfamily ATPase